MKNKPLLTLFATVFLLASSSIVSAETLLQIYDLAKQNDHEYKVALASYLANREAKNIARGALLPQLSLEGSYIDEDTDTESPNEGLAVDTDTETTSYNVRLEQAIINFNALNNFRSGKSTSNAAEAQLKADEQSLIIRSSEAYFNVLRAIDQLRTSKSVEKALATQLEQTQQRYEVGLISINDVYEVQAGYDSSLANRLDAEVNVGLQLEALAIITGQNHQRIAPLKDNFEATLPSPNDKQAWIESAQKNNSSLQVSRFNAEAARFDAKAAKADRLPTLAGSISYENRDREIDSGENDTDSDITTARIDLSFPLFRGGTLTASQRQAEQTSIFLRQQFLLDQRNTIQNTRSLFLSVTTDIAQIKARKQAIISGQSALQATQAGYEAGTRDIVDVVNAQRNLFEAQSEYFTALYDYIINILLLKEVAGGLSVEDLQALETW
ncbi:MAG: TolC family outer membrane protein, partial [Pseudomonadota bacterium]